MCDFHSSLISVLGDVYHLPSNSHSEIAAHFKLRENEPHKRPSFVEAEWDGSGEYPGADKICRVQNGEELSAKQRAACDSHYKALATYLSGPSPSAALASKFSSPDYSDVRLARFNRNHAKLTSELLGLIRRINDAQPGCIDSLTLERGRDYSMAWPRFALWLMIDTAGGVIRFAKTAKAKSAIKGVAALYSRWIETGKKPDAEEWEKARSDADDAAAYAAYAAAYAAYAAYAAADAAYAADAAADAAAYAAQAAAYAAYAADAADAADARKLQWSRMAEKLSELLK